jgi:hypothetical protein
MDANQLFPVLSGFLHHYNWSSWYSWNIAESGVKHNKKKLFPLVVYTVFGGLMISVLASSAVDRVFKPRSGQTKDYKIWYLLLPLSTEN